MEKVMMTAPVRLRLVLADEFRILIQKDKTFDPPEHVAKLVEQKREIERRRDAAVKSLALGMVLIFLFENGINITIPSVSVPILDIPNLLLFLVPWTMFSFFLVVWQFINDQVYRAFIDQAVNEIAAYGVVDPDVFSAAYQPQDLALKLFRNRSNIWAPDSLQPAFAAKAINLLVNVTISLAFLAVIVFVDAFLAIRVKAIWDYGNGGILAALFAGVLLILANLMLIVLVLPMRFIVSDQPSANDLGNGG